MQNKKEGEDLLLACKWVSLTKDGPTGTSTLSLTQRKRRYEIITKEHDMRSSLSLPSKLQVLNGQQVGEYWSLYDMIYKVQELIPNTDYLVFKSHIAPQWEDPQNRDGGKWVYTVPLDADPDPDLLEDIWLRMLAALIGNNFGEEYNNLVNGAVFGVREKHYRFGLWIGTNSNLKALKSIGKKFRELCELPKKFQLVYQVHVKALKHQLDNEFLLEA